MALSPDKLAKIQAAKAPIASVMDQFNQIAAQKAALETQVSPYIETLVKTAGRPGPFRFGDKDFYFRKNGRGDGGWNIREEAESV